MYSEVKPNIEHIRAVAEDIAARLTREYGTQITVKAEGGLFCLITLPCRNESIIQISDIDAGMAPLSADIFYGDCFEEIYSVDYKDDGEFAAAVCDFVRGFFGRQLRVTRKSKFFGGTDTKTEYLENGEWVLHSEDSDKSFIMRILTWRNKTSVSEYDFRIK